MYLLFSVQHLQILERELLTAEDNSVPVYFTWETPEIVDIYESVTAGSGDDAATAVEGDHEISVF